MFDTSKQKKVRLAPLLVNSILLFGLWVYFNGFVYAKAAKHPIFAPELITLTEEKALLNPSGCTLQDMVDFYKAELKIEHTDIIFLRRRMKDPNLHGYTQPRKGKYVVTLAKGLEPSELRIITAHELVHVRQFVEGSITIKVFEKEVKKDYLERSFEDEAFRLSEPLAIKFYQTLNCKQKSLD